MEQNKMMLVFGNQMVFKKYARKLLNYKCKFYFDNIYCVDEETSNNIPNVECDGTITFEKAVKRLEKYFNDKFKAAAKAKKDAKKIKEKAKKAEAKAKKDAKKAKELERKKAKAEAKKAKLAAKKAKEQAKREKARAKNAALKEKMKLAKKKERVEEKVKKNQIKKAVKKPNSHLEVSIEIDAQEASKIMKNTLIKTANELAVLNDKKRAKRIEKLSKLGYSVQITDNMLVVKYDAPFVLTMAASESQNAQPTEIKEIVNPNVQETETDMIIANTVECDNIALPESLEQPTETDDYDTETVVDIDCSDIDNLDDNDFDAEATANEAIAIEDGSIDDFEDDDFENDEDRRFDDETDEDKIDYRREYYEDDDMIADFEQ